MPSRITINERIVRAQIRKENTLNLSFQIESVLKMAQVFGIDINREGADILSESIVNKILGKDR